MPCAAAGAYDGLVELLGGPPTKGIGFAIGEDRLILSAAGEREKRLPSRAATSTSPGWVSELTPTAIRAAKVLRKAGFSVELPPVEQKFGKALGQADKLGAKYALILGDNEVSEGPVDAEDAGGRLAGKVHRSGFVGIFAQVFVVAGL